jgi:hypothetical protein
MSEEMASETHTGADGPPYAADQGSMAEPAGAPPAAPGGGDPAGDASAPSIEDARAPGGLRLARGAAGVVLLALAWGAVMAALLLGLNTLGVPPHRHVFVRIALYVVGAVGACWLGLVAVAALVAGAFCLTMAFTRREW